MEQPSNPARPDAPVLEDGELVFRVRRVDGSETDHRLDLLCLKLTCEACEEQHGLQVKDGCLRPTPDFLVDLARRIESLGLDRCTPTLAWKVWIAAADGMQGLKKTESETPK